MASYGSGSLKGVVARYLVFVKLLLSLSYLPRDITKSCGLAKEKRWRILVGVETYKAVKSRKEDTPCATIPHSLKPFEMKFT